MFQTVLLCTLTELLSVLQEFPASRGRAERGPERSGGRVRHRNRGRRRCSRHRPAAPALRGHDLDPDLRWGAGALRPYRGPHPIYKIKCLHQTPSHSFHIQAARTNRRFSPTSITPRGSDRMGWQQKHVGGRLLTAVSSVDVIYPYCLKPSSCVRSFVYSTGMKMYWLLWDDVWTVCLICCLILTCTVIQSPFTPVNVVTSLCCGCEYKCLPLCPFPSIGFLFSVFCWWFWL